MSAVDLARNVVTNELKVQDEEHRHWMYRLDKEEYGRKQTLEILGDRRTNPHKHGDVLAS